MTYKQPAQTLSSSKSRSPSFSSSSYNSSPIRHSPLSQPPILAYGYGYGISRTPSPILGYGQNGSKPIPTPSHRGSGRSCVSPLTSLISPTSPTYATISSFNEGSLNTPHRDSSPNTPNDVSSTPSPSQSPSLSRSQPLLGSYHLSLFHSRMSAHQPHESNQIFSLSLNSIGKGKSCPSNLRCTNTLEIPFSAIYFDLNDPTEFSLPSPSPSSIMGSTPWTSNLNLENHYFNSFSSTSYHKQNPTKPPVEPPSFPGYEVSSIGQLQILIKTKDSPIKVYLIPYDLRKVPIGGRLLVREKTYFRCSSIEEGGNLTKEGKRILKYAIQLQFVCVPSSLVIDHGEEDLDNPFTTRNQRIKQFSTQSNVASSSAPQQGEKSYYVSKSLKLVFVSSPPDKSEIMEIERTDEIIEPPSSIDNSPPMKEGNKKRRTSFAFSPGSLGKTSEDWEMLRSKWFTKRNLEQNSTLVQDHSLNDQAQNNDSTHQISSKRILDFEILDKPKMIRKPSLISTTSPSTILPNSSITSPSYSASTSASLSIPTSKPILSPIPILSPLPIRSGQINRSRPSTPTSPRPISPYLTGNGHEPALIWSPKSQRRMRREDGLEEVELSEKLRKMDLNQGRE